ncbi:hypothetical protein [Thauera sp.]|uniref:hypothetical protein n=1 Tax=Thauera sp. TaxID=1905334 RepID=UPI002C77DE87|nr:hypothetical protein [Thauera sp.]HRP25394.1 hypothetical protein [Thauera sp.]
MGSIWIKEFRGGLDTRRLPETLPGGALIRAQDCHITQGGELEQRAVFAPIWTDTAGISVGLAADEDSLVVFGNGATPPADLPPNVSYQQLVHPDDSNVALLGVPSWQLFGGEIAAIGLFEENANERRFMYLNGVHVSDTNAPPQAAGSVEPTSLGVHFSKIFVGAGTVMFFSDNEDGDDFTNAGAGFVDMAFRVGGGAKVRAFSDYERILAVFSDRAITTWKMDADPDNTAIVQTLRGFGTFAARTAIQFRGADVLFYDLSGIRSLRARDSSGTAQTADVGSPIDKLTSKAIEDLSVEQREFAAAIVEPRTGRIWFAIGDTIFVLSQYEATKVTAWSTYKPGFQIEGIAVLGDRVYLRSGDTIYVYGSETGPYQYGSDVQAEAWLPYLDANAPTKSKTLMGIDAAVRGAWEVRVGYDPRNLDATDLVARITSTTYPDPRVPLAQGRGTHIGLRFRSIAPPSTTEPAVVSAAVIVHDLDDPEDAAGS